MSKRVYAIFDGRVLHPEEPVELEPNTRVRLTIEDTESLKAEACSLFQTPRSLKLEGPSDWSARFEEYLYDEKTNIRE